MQRITPTAPAIILLIAIPLSTLAQRATPTRINFRRGTVSAQVTGRFKGDQHTPFVVKAKAGDHMIVNIIAVTRGLTMAGTVASPSGQGDGGPGGIIFNDDLKESGDYRIEAFQHTMGSNYQAGSFIVEVVITPSWLKT